MFYSFVSFCVFMLPFSTITPAPSFLSPLYNYKSIFTTLGSLEKVILTLYMFIWCTLFTLILVKNCSTFVPEQGTCHGMTSLPPLHPPLATSDCLCLHSASSTS